MRERRAPRTGHRVMGARVLVALPLAAVALSLAACGNTQQQTVQSPGAAPETVLPSPQLQTESAPPGDVPAPATQPPASP
ncbi:MAG: hypothetical protein M3301_06530 [Chloroflexota bacterium]|nr:hypothetical protein [Chloroflexota bacterium]